MKSSFGKRLFRLFLAFSLVPAILLTLAGYYLAVQTNGVLMTTTGLDATGVTNYYTDYLFAKIDTCMDVHLNDTTTVPAFPDLMFTVSNGQIRPAKDHQLSTPEVFDKIVRASLDRPSGFIESDGIIIQFRSRILDGNRRLIAGLIHTPEYSRLLESVQDDYASRSTGAELRSRYLFFLGIVFAVLSAIAAGVAYCFSVRIAKNLSRPLAQLDTASKEIAAGNFGHQIKASGTGEIQTLITSFNQMAGQLETTTARLAQSERVAAWRNVARRFAHELKNPLQPILISLYRIEKILTGSSRYAQVIEPLRAATEELKHLTNLTDRFSQLAKLPPPSLETVNLSELLSSLRKLYREQLAAYDFSITVPAKTVYARLDPDYFREALHNLIANAIDASDVGTRIILTLCTHDDRIDIVVQDFGKGMSAETISSARLPYFTTKEKGSGLGLAIVEKVITECSGQLFIDSKQNSGTRVTISLPREN